jgi:hypothetical protein
MAVIVIVMAMMLVMVLMLVVNAPEGERRAEGKKSERLQKRVS